MKKRFFFDLLILLAVFFMPWWFVVIVSLVYAFLFSPFYEIIALGVLSDLLYGAHSLAFGGALGTTSAVVVFLIANYARKEVR